MKAPLRIAFAGLGTVGGGVIKALQSAGTRLPPAPVGGLKSPA